jgi:cystathionine gamma-synthase
MSPKPLRPATLAAQALGWTDPATGAVVLPVHTATTFERDPDNQYRRGRGYARADNPTYDQPEALITTLEGGAASLLFASGMAAAAAVFDSLPPGSHAVAPRVMYWALRRRLAAAGNEAVAVDFVDATSLHELRRAVVPGRTQLVWIETPANPLWSITDIAAAAGIAHAAGALLAIDSTAATPVLTRPLALGADIVMHSATKYLNGHSDVIAAWSPPAAAAAPFSAASRRFCCCAACARCSRGSSAPAGRRSGSPRHSPAIHASRRYSTPACQATPATPSPRARWRAGSAGC